MKLVNLTVRRSFVCSYKKTPFVPEFRSYTQNKTLPLAPLLSFPYILLLTSNCKILVESNCDSSLASTSVERPILKPNETTILERLQQIVRIFELLLLFAPLWLSYLPCALIGEPVLKKWRSVLITVLQYCGPTFIKFGQWASTRADLFSQELRRDLSLSLAKNNTTQPFDRVAAAIETAFGLEESRKYFSKINTNAIGAGCIAQVHCAELAGNSEIVVAKVIVRKLEKAFIRDLHILRTCAKLIQAFIPLAFGLDDIVEEFSSFMLSQLDLKKEADNINQFNINFADSKRIGFPKVRRVSSDGKVLVETFVPGTVLSDMLSELHEKAEPSPLEGRQFCKDVANLGLKAFLQMVLVDNLVHSDLHPGNIIIQYRQRPGEEAKLEKISFIDFGLVTSLSPIDKKNFIDLFLAVAKGDGEEAGYLMVTRSSKRPACGNLTENEKNFVAGMKQVVAEHGSSNFSLDRVRIGRVLQDVLHLVYKYHVPIDTNFSTLVMSFVLAEGILRQLDASLNIFTVALPILCNADAEYKALINEAIF